MTLSTVLLGTDRHDLDRIRGPFHQNLQRPPHVDEESSKGNTLSTADLAVLQAALTMMERVTYTEAEMKPDTAN